MSILISSYLLTRFDEIIIASQRSFLGIIDYRTEKVKEDFCSNSASAICFTNYSQNDLANTHRRELECEAERQRLAAGVSVSPKQNALKLAISKLGVLLVGLGIWMKQMERVEQRPMHVTGKL